MTLSHEIDARLQQAGIILPQAPAAAGNYQRVVCRRGFGFVSGQFPLRSGQLIHSGRVGIELTLEQGRECAVIAAANALAQIRLVLGRWERFAGLLRVDGYVASADDFLQQPAVLDSASEFFVRVLGSILGAHARTAFHATRLPITSPLELAVTFMGSTGARAVRSKRNKNGRR
jgi:enamine deaminase RidA (YjgF/YER057c/UK114 family)